MLVKNSSSSIILVLACYKAMVQAVWLRNHVSGVNVVGSFLISLKFIVVMFQLYFTLRTIRDPMD